MNVIARRSLAWLAAGLACALVPAARSQPAATV